MFNEWLCLGSREGKVWIVPLGGGREHLNGQESWRGRTMDLCCMCCI